MGVGCSKKRPEKACDCHKYKNMKKSNTRHKGRPPIDRRYDTAVPFIGLKTIGLTRIRGQKVSVWE